jgi:hypothetical protein
MRTSERLRALDNRVLGAPKRKTAENQRRTFFVGLTGTALVLVVIAVTGRWWDFAAVGGFLGVTLGAGLGWRRGTREER